MKPKNKPLPGSRWYSYVFLYGILKPILFIYFHLFQNVHFKRNGYRFPKGPVFFIGNHHTNWDGFYHCIMFYWRFPHYIVHDEVFKNKRYSAIFGTFLGQVKRGSDNSDITPILALKRLLDSGQSVNVYPEGDIHMFGRTMNLDKSIAKMAQLFKVPVVLTRVHGAHLRAPRWSNLAHHSRITYEISDIISKEQITTMTTDDLFERIKTGITVNAYDDQIAKPIKLRGGHRGEWLELGLYLCPHCNNYQTLVSRGNDFTCIQCGLTGHVDHHLLLDTHPRLYFRRPDVWDDWQYEQLKSLIIKTDRKKLLFTCVDGLFEQVASTGFFTKKGNPAVGNIYGDHIEIITQEGKIVNTMIKDIIDVRLQYKDVFEWNDGNQKYRLWRPVPKWSAYLWVNCVNIAQSL